MNLAAIQLLSLVTKGITIALGVVQALLVVHFLTKPEFGVVGLVMAIGSVIGVTQHLGVVDGAIREIAVLKRRDEVGKIFWVSHLMRQVVTLPLSVGLFLMASILAQRVYNLPEMATLIQLYAASLVLLGIQDVLGATLTGIKKFISLYVVQIGTAVINIGVFAYFTWRWSMTGYFWAIIVTTAIMVIWYGAIIARALSGYLALPGWADITFFAKRVFRTSSYMYAARILFVVWQRLPLLVLGIVVAKDQLGDLALSLTFGSKLTILAMALAEVNLSWMSSLFVRDQREWQRVVTHNMQRLFFVLLAVTTVLIFFAPEILHLPILLKYLPARNLVIVMTVAFFIYALLDIATNSVFVAADKPRWRALLYSLMTAVTGLVMGWLVMFRPDPFLATLGVLVGAVMAYLLAVAVAWRRLGIPLLTRSLTVILLVLLGTTLWLLTSPALMPRMLVFAGLVLYFTHEIRRSKLLPSIKSLAPGTRHGTADSARYKFICFAGAFYDAPTWTNRQHIMSRFSEQHPVLYVEPRVWLVRYLVDHWRDPASCLRFIKRIVWWEQPSSQLYIKSQWNLIPGSREYSWISRLNHWLNRTNVLLGAKILGFVKPQLIVWIYDTEAAEYLDAFPEDTVVYDCVDDHSVQAGPNRNPERVRAEEKMILRRANLVTVTSQHLYDQKKPFNPNTHLIEQGGDVAKFFPVGDTKKRTGPPIIGSVGALDSYKYDFDLIELVARTHPEWQFVFVGEPMVREKRHALGAKSLADVARLPNVKLAGSIPREKVPSYVQLFDVCIIPYRANDYNRSSFPLKFWEFMATGKPIVVSGLPELKKYDELIAYTTTAPHFVAELQKAIRSPVEAAQQRIELARHHSWEKRVEQLLALLQNIGHD